jgi:hypothetical protein
MKDCEIGVGAVSGTPAAPGDPQAITVTSDFGWRQRGRR